MRSDHPWRTRQQPRGQVQTQRCGKDGKHRLEVSHDPVSEKAGSVATSTASHRSQNTDNDESCARHLIKTPRQPHIDQERIFQYQPK